MMMLRRCWFSLYLGGHSEETGSDVRNRLVESEVESHVESVLVHDLVVVAVKDHSSNPS